jgi:hypothetical protein
MTDPKRLIDPDSRSSPTLRVLLRAARSELPDEERVEAIGMQVAAMVGPATVGVGLGSSAAPAAPGAGGAAATGVKLGLAAKMGVVALVAAGTAGGGYALTSLRTTGAGSSSLAAAGRSNAATTWATTTATTVPPTAPAASAPVDPSPAAEAPRPIPVQTATGAQGAGTADAELTLLASAQDALASNPEVALSLAESHAARFPHAVMVQEREVIAIEALLRLGRVEAARARADRFYRAFPRSAHRARIESLLDGSSHNP